jgi:tRNA threonylcarbamoyladenosine modification (KEOPS) complex  Pcc1 subunit
MIDAEIKVCQDIDTIAKLFQPELKETKTDRAHYTLEKKKGCLIFRIQAKDIVALKAVLNSITKILEVHEKLK